MLWTINIIPLRLSLARINHKVINVREILAYEISMSRQSIQERKSMVYFLTDNRPTITKYQVERTIPQNKIPLCLENWINYKRRK